jgi:uncharacterized membrane protein YgdD (TMEM256/DUF423 family)
MPWIARTFIVVGALASALAVILGAAAAHIPVVAQAASNPSLTIALQMHQFHALGLLLTGLLALRLPDSRWVQFAGMLMLYGLFAFSANLYLRTLAGIDTFRVLVPSGGGAWIVAWLSLALGAARGQRRY